MVRVLLDAPWVGAAVVGAAVVGAAVVGAAVVGAEVVGAVVVVGDDEPLQPVNMKPITRRINKGNRNSWKQPDGRQHYRGQ